MKNLDITKKYDWLIILTDESPYLIEHSDLQHALIFLINSVVCMSEEKLQRVFTALSSFSNSNDMISFANDNLEIYSDLLISVMIPLSENGFINTSLITTISPQDPIAIGNESDSMFMTCNNIKTGK